MLYTLDVAPTQVLIEARFMEVDITDTTELGLEWKLDADFPTKLERRVTGSDHQQIISKDSGLDFASLARATEGFNLTYKGLLTQPQFEAVLHLLSESKKIKTLSSPRITTLSNQLATIKVVDEWIYPTRYEYEVVQTDKNGDGDFSDAGETTYKNVPKDFMRRDVGILLKVIPSVGADKKTINLSLIPEVSEGAADGFTYAGEVTLPKFTSRNLSTTVIANSGDTVVLGGMIKESRTKTVTKVPFFGDIPILGHLFRQSSDSVQRKNLLIFVTARVISPSGQEVVVAENK
jgi:general secretion pathway protein D